MTDTGTVYISCNDYNSGHGPVLRCISHPKWEVDVDGGKIDDAMVDAQRHVKEDHEDA